MEENVVFGLCLRNGTISDNSLVTNYDAQFSGLKRFHFFPHGHKFSSIFKTISKCFLPSHF